MPSSALAQGAGDDDTPATGEDEALYSCGKAKGQVSVSFKPEVELKDLITWAMGFTCKNFVYGTGIGGRSAKVTIIAPKKMTPQQAWRVFLVGLQTMGLTIVPKGNVNKIVEAKQSKGEALPLYRSGTPESKSQLVRLVMRPEHIPVDDLATALNALKSGDGQVTTLNASGIIVVTDYADNIYSMKSLMREIDQQVVGERVYMIKIIHADATDLAAKLIEVVGTKESKGAGAAASSRSTTATKKGSKKAAEPAQTVAEVETAVPSKIIPDEASNSLLILASEAAYLRVRALVKRLDVPMEGQQGGGRIHVYYLENADAEELGTTLNTVITGLSQSSNQQQRGNQRQPQRAATADGGGTPAFEGQVRITHDKPTNSLIVVASVRDFQALKGVIEKLDLPRTQVFIEAIILEVTADNSLNLGTSWHGGKDLSDGSIIIGGAQHDDLRSLNLASLATQTGLLGGLVGPLLPNAEQLLGTSVPSYGVLFQALATSNNVNVLSSPHLLTTDNEPAEISVGENIPYQSSFSNFGAGAGGGAGGFAVPVQSVQRTDVALTLKITPHVNQSNMVRLEIDQEISDIASPDFAGLGPSWSKRSIKTTVVVGDQQTIVIGGLMQDKVTYSESKVPLLGDIPILGYLFKYTQKSKQKANLLVMLTPYIIKDQMDIEQIVQRKVRERDEFVRSFSNFARMTYRPEIDYRRKRGLVEEINHTMAVIERDRQILQDLEQRDETFRDGPVEYEPEDLEIEDPDKTPAPPPDGITDADGGDDGKKADVSGEGKNE